MKHLSIFKTYTFRVDLPKITDKVTFIPFGDVHRDTSACDVDRWRWFLKKSREDANAENTYYLGMGDYHDFASYRESKKIHAMDLHDQTIEAIDELVQKRNRAFAMEIKQMRGKLIGLLGGNHTWIKDGKTSDEDLADRMGCEYLGWVSFINLVITIGKSSVHRVGIFACHGLGGGRVLGSGVRKVEDLFHIIPSADIYLMGHDHGRGAWPQPRLVPKFKHDGSVAIKQQRQFFCRTGSFMKSYQEGQSSYAVSKLMKPADLGALRLDIGFHRDRTKGDETVTLDIEALL